MDLTSIIGLGVAIAFVIYGILSGGSLLTFYDLPSLYIVFGGSLGAVIISTPMGQLKNFHKMIRNAFVDKNFNSNEIIKQILDLSYTARKEGLLSLENKAEELTDPYFKKGILLAVDGMESQIIKDVLGAEIDALENRHKANRNMLDVAAVLFPAFGMIGTLIGLINMLKDLSSPDKIGPQMAIALVTTFYGTIISNLVIIPLSRKLKAKTEQEVMIKEIIIEGVVSIQSGENTRFVEQKLLSYLNPQQKEILLGGKSIDQK